MNIPINGYSHLGIDLIISHSVCGPLGEGGVWTTFPSSQYYTMWSLVQIQKAMICCSNSFMRTREPGEKVHRHAQNITKKIAAKNVTTVVNACIHRRFVQIKIWTTMLPLSCHLVIESFLTGSLALSRENWEVSLRKNLNRSQWAGWLLLLSVYECVGECWHVL